MVRHKASNLGTFNVCLYIQAYHEWPTWFDIQICIAHLTICPPVHGMQGHGLAHTLIIILILSRARCTIRSSTDILSGQSRGLNKFVPLVFVDWNQSPYMYIVLITYFITSRNYLHINSSSNDAIPRILTKNILV